MYKILSLDQSTSCVGYAIFEDGELVQFGKFEPNPKQDSDKRIYSICSWLQRAINVIEDVDLVILEDIQLQTTINGSGKYFKNQDNNVLTFKVLAKLQGALIAKCLELGVNYHIVQPSHWKSIVGITSKYRRDQKKEAMELVEKWFGENAVEDEADAICIGFSYIKEKES